MNTTPSSYLPLYEALEDYFEPMLFEIMSGPRPGFNQYTDSITDMATYSPVRYVTMWRTDRYVSNQSVGLMIEAGAEHIKARFPTPELIRMVADMYFDSAGWWPEGTARVPYPDRVDDLALIKHAVLARLLVECPPPDIAARVEARIRGMMIEHIPFENPVEKCTNLSSSEDLNAAFLPPNLRECVDLLYALPPTPAVLDLMVALWQGKFDDPSAPPVIHRGPAGTPQQERSVLASLVPFARRLEDAGRLDYELFREFVYNHRPNAVCLMIPPQLQQALADRPELFEKLNGFRVRLFEEAAADLSNRSNRRIIEGFFIYCLEGPQWLMYAVRWAAAAKRKKPVLDTTRADGTFPDRVFDEPTIARQLIQAYVPYAPLGSEPGRAEQVAELRRYPPFALEALLPQTGNARWLLMEALGWQAAIPLVTLFFTTFERYYALARAESNYEWETGAPKCRSQEVGVLDVAAARAAIALDPRLNRHVMELFAKGHQLPHLVMLFSAVAGWNRAEVLAKFANGVLSAIRAYGLLPLQSATEAAERRAELEKLAVEGGLRPLPKRMNQKKAALHAAIMAGLKNLDQVENC